MIAILTDDSFLTGETTMNVSDLVEIIWVFFWGGWGEEWGAILSAGFLK